MLKLAHYENMKIRVGLLFFYGEQDKICPIEILVLDTRKAPAL